MERAAHEAKNIKKPAVKVGEPSSGVQEYNQLTYEQQSVLALQGLIGNAAVQRMMQSNTIQRDVTVENAPQWATNERQVRRIQGQLRRLGLYRQSRDGDYGRGTDSALVEAFGSDDFRNLSANEVLDRLRAADTPEGRRGEHRMRFGEMFRDGVLDLTVAVGYDEARDGRADATAYRQITAALAARGFREDNRTAAELYRRAGRTFVNNDVDVYYVRNQPLTYQPPAGEERRIQIVVRLIRNPDETHGAQAADTFQEGMVQSDATYYAGHGRYGSGPDFDRNFARFTLRDPRDRTRTEEITDYEDLETRLTDEGRAHGRGPWQQFMWRRRRRLIDFQMVNAGNVYLNPERIQNKFGARLIHYCLERSGTPVDSGRRSELATEAAEHPERRYRVVVFDGCTTRDYEDSFRSTPGFGRGTTQTIETTRTAYWGDYGRTLGAFIDSIIEQQSTEEIVRNMDDEQATMRRVTGRSSDGTFESHGTSYDPVIR
jgi:hypothetical protein